MRGFLDSEWVHKRCKEPEVGEEGSIAALIYYSLKSKGGGVQKFSLVTHHAAPKSQIRIAQPVVIHIGSVLSIETSIN